MSEGAVEPIRWVEIGIGLQMNKPPGRYSEIAALAESVGIDVVTVFGDLRFQPPIAALLEAAAATERVRLGVACWNPYTLHPYEIAGQFAAIDRASGGRAYLGLARGSWLEAIGIRQNRPLQTLEEAAGFIAALLASDGRGYDGQIFTLASGIAFDYELTRRIAPVLIGSWGPRGAELAGRIADEIKIGGTANPAMVSLTRSRVAIGERAVGRPVGTVGVVVGAVTVISQDRLEARSLARREVAMYIDVIAGLDSTLDLPDGMLSRVREKLRDGDREAAGRNIPDDVLDLFSFSGTPEDVTAQTQQLIDAGASRIEYGTPHGFDELEGIRLIGERIVPQLDRSRGTDVLRQTLSEHSGSIQQPRRLGSVD